MNQEVFSLRRDSAELEKVLFEGEMLRHGERWAALPRETVFNAGGGIESVVFEAIRPGELQRPSRLKIALEAIRPQALTLTFTPSFVVFAYGLYMNWPISWTIAALSCLGAVLLQISVQTLNDVEDHLRLIDLPETLAGSGVLQKGWLKARDLKNLGYVQFALGVLFGIPALLAHPAYLIFIGAVGALGVLIYSTPPFEIKYRAFGDVFLFSIAGPLFCLGFSIAAFGHFDGGVLGLGCFFGFLAGAISHSRNLQDLELDRARGIPTPATRLGFRASRHVLVLLYIGALLSLLSLIYFGFLPVLITAALVPPLVSGFCLLSKVYRASGPLSALLISLGSDASRVHLIAGVCVASALFVAFLF